MNISRRNFIIGGASSIVCAAAIPALSSCSNNTVTKSGLKISDFESNGVGKLNPELQTTYTADTPTKLCVLKNKNGAEVCITNFGARIVSIMVPDKDGKFKDVVLGFSSIKEYTTVGNLDNVMGAQVGRVIGRTENAKFTLDGEEYNLEKNYKGKHNIHGGRFGWYNQTWDVIEQSENSVTMKIVSPDGDAGFPGEITYRLIFTLTDENSLILNSGATTTKRTPLNSTNHAYFNLDGDPTKDIFDYQIQINAHSAAGIKEDDVADGTIIEIPQGDELDFYSKPKSLKKDIDLTKGIFQYSKGYDFSYYLDSNQKVNASVYSPLSHIKLEVITDRPVINFYDAHDLNGEMTGKNNISYNSCCAFCVEGQAFCNAVNDNLYLNSILSPGQIFTSTTEYKFSVE